MGWPFEVSVLIFTCWLKVPTSVQFGSSTQIEESMVPGTPCRLAYRTYATISCLVHNSSSKILSRHFKGNDDALVLVARYLGAPHE